MLQFKDRKVVLKSIAFSPDGRLLAAGADRGAVQLWDAVTGQLRAKLKGAEGGGGNRVFFNSDGLTLIGVGSKVVTWFLPRPAESADIWLGDGDRRGPTAQSPDGKRLTFTVDNGGQRLLECHRL